MEMPEDGSQMRRYRALIPLSQRQLVEVRNPWIHVVSRMQDNQTTSSSPSTKDMKYDILKGVTS